MYLKKYCCSVAQSCLTLWNPMDCSVPGFPILCHFPSLPKLMSITSVMPSSHPIISCPLLLLPSIFSSNRHFTSELAFHIRWLKHWSFSFSITHSNKYSRLISLKIDWFDLLDVQGNFRSLLKHHSLKASILQPSVLKAEGLSGSWYVLNSTLIKITL